ncbi:MAG: putative porin [Bacteroidales bacterium]|nr:putative porin [Bacteroidales bacterium]
MKPLFLSARRLWIVVFLGVFALAAAKPGPFGDDLRMTALTQDTLRRIMQDTLRPGQDSLMLTGRDSLMLAGRDSLILAGQDSLMLTDSIISLSQRELRRVARDSIRAVRDSIRSQPRMMESFYFPDSLYFKRILVWTHDRYINSAQMSTLDTLMNSTIYDHAFFKEDVGATYLGVAGSATLYHNYFKRPRVQRFDAYSPYIGESFTPESLPFYNTKSPYTELAYYGTFFANKQKEETNIKILHTQNLSPELNFSTSYKRFGGNGMLVNEATKTRTFTTALNYIGRQYIMHGGYIHNQVHQNNNGGVADEFWIRDTIVDVRTVPVYLQNSNSSLKKNTFFITQMYGIPIRLFKSDTLNVGEGTMMFLGHSGTFATYSRFYRDEIAVNNAAARAFYNDNFYYSPTSSQDSIRTQVIDNRFFIRLQPWSRNAIVSKLDGGIGYEFLSNYAFSPEYYLTGAKNQLQNNAYFYAGASGLFKNYFAWNALGRVDLTGYYQGDLSINGSVRFSAYPLEQGIHLTGNLKMEHRTPDWHTRYYFGNHRRWDESFDKILENKISANLEIPKWKLEAFFGYAMLTNNIHYNLEGIPQQSSEMLSIMSAYLKKDFHLWMLRFDHRILAQFSSNQEIMPLPLVSANLRYYFQFRIIPNALTAQIGADLTFNTKYYAPAYDPDTGNFRIQNQREIGNNPYIDAFANLTWKRATIFVKYINAAMPWPSGDYFSALGYIRPQKSIKFGVTWPFYIHASNQAL